jgi:hypothetical protein
MALLAALFALMGLGVLAEGMGWFAFPRAAWGAFWLFGLAAFFLAAALRPRWGCAPAGGRWQWVPDEPPKQT